MPGFRYHIAAHLSHRLSRLTAMYVLLPARIRTTAAWCALLAALLPTTAAADQPTAIRVLQVGTSTPIAQARVTVLPSGVSTSADELGVARVMLTDASCIVLVSAPGFGDSSVPCIELAQDGGAQVFLWLAAGPLRLQEGVVVTASRGAEASFDVPGLVTSVDQDILRRKRPRTTPEALFDAAGVLVQKTNHGGGSPYVRGLVGNQVLVLVDGMRMNNTTYRYGPNQLLHTVDPGEVERIEVLRGGAGSVLYGSDALGGVINVITKKPALGAPSPTWRIAFAPRVATSGLEQSGRVDVDVEGSRASLRVGLAGRNYGDLVAGGQLGTLAPSGYHEVNGDGALTARLSDRQTLTVSWQRVAQRNVPRYDQVAQRGFALYIFEPQRRQSATATWRVASRHPWFASANVTAAWIDTFEGRERRRQSSTVLTREEDGVRSYVATAQAETSRQRSWQLRYGVDVAHDNVSSSRRDSDLISGAASTLRGLYPSGASATTAAVFALATASRGRLHVDFGSRASRVAVRADDATFGNVRLAPSSVVHHAAVSVEWREGLHAFGSISQAFRAPNVDDVSTLGLFDSGIEIPAPGLVPERSTTWEGGLKLKRGRFRGALAAYRSNLRELIERARATLGGAEFVDGQRIFRKVNIGQAYVRGVEAEGELWVADPVMFYGHVTQTYGHQTTTNQPMRRIPPVHGLLGVRVSSGAWWLDGSVRAAGRQNRLSPGDRDDHRIDPRGTPGWWVASLGLGHTWRSTLDVTLGLENLFNAAYRVHGSGVDGVGRHAWLGTVVRF